MILYIDLSGILKLLAHFLFYIFLPLLFSLKMYTDLNVAKATLEINATTTCCFSLSCKAQSLNEFYQHSLIDMKNLILWVRSCSNVSCADLVRVMTCKAAKESNKNVSLHRCTGLQERMVMGRNALLYSVYFARSSHSAALAYSCNGDLEKEESEAENGQHCGTYLWALLATLRLGYQHPLHR